MSDYPSQSPERMREYNRAYYAANRDKIKAATRRYAIARPEKTREQKRRYKQKPEARAKANRRFIERQREDPNFAIVVQVRRRLYAALKGRKITKRAEQLFGCSRQELREHIEKQFRPGMSWANRGEWEVDHIRPISSFDLADIVQLEAASHFTNLQPLWRDENQAKGAKWL